MGIHVQYDVTAEALAETDVHGRHMGKSDVITFPARDEDVARIIAQNLSDNPLLHQVAITKRTTTVVVEDIPLKEVD